LTIEVLEYLRKSSPTLAVLAAVLRSSPDKFDSAILDYALSTSKKSFPALYNWVSIKARDLALFYSLQVRSDRASTPFPLHPSVPAAQAASFGAPTSKHGMMHLLDFSVVPTFTDMEWHCQSVFHRVELAMTRSILAATCFSSRFMDLRPPSRHRTRREEDDHLRLVSAHKLTRHHRSVASARQARSFSQTTSLTRMTMMKVTWTSQAHRARYRHHLWARLGALKRNLSIYQNLS
jgi:hypothetical protein